MNILSQLLINLILLGSQVRQPDSDFIKLERKGGYGPPFGYSVTVYSDGTVEYVGNPLIRVAGKRSYKISKDSVAYLIHRADEIGIFSLKPKYIFGIKLQKNKSGSIDTLTISVQDLPMNTVTVRIGNRNKSVVDYFRSYEPDKELKSFEAPEKLREYENEIDRIAQINNLE
jgi:hypothetical protein